MSRCLRIIADQSFHAYLQPLEVLENRPEVPSAVVDYREATGDAAATTALQATVSRPASTRSSET